VLLRSVGLKTLRDLRRGFLLWSAGLVGLVAMLVSVYPSIRKNPALDTLVQSYPGALKGFIGFGGELDYSTPAGYLGMELFSLMVPLLLLIAAVAAGSAAIAGEEERGTLDLLLSLPVSRQRVALEKLGALVAETSGLGVVLWLSLWIGSRAAGMKIGAGHLGAATIGAVLLAIGYGCIALMLGAATGRRGLSIGLAAAAAVAAYLVNSLAPLVSALDGVQRATPFYYYAEGDPLRQGLEVADALVLLAVGVAAGAIAVVAAERRDLGS
jgi:ABC-2 type transport system permease protein